MRKPAEVYDVIYDAINDTISVAPPCGDYYARTAGRHLTVFRSRETDEIVGFEIAAVVELTCILDLPYEALTTMLENKLAQKRA